MPNVTKPVEIGESSDVVHDDTTGGTDGNPHTLSADTNHGNEAHSSDFTTVSTAPMGDADGDDVLENGGSYRGVVISDSTGGALLTVTESSDGTTVTIEASDTVTVNGDVACTGEVKENQTL